MANKIAMRMQTPADRNGVRTDIHPITTTDEVIVNADSENPITLTEKLDKIVEETSGIKNYASIVIQKEQPDFPCLWAKPVE